MTLKTTIASDRSVFINSDEFAEEITIGADTVDAIVDLGVFRPGEGYSPDARMGTVWVSTDDLSTPPAYRTTVTIGSETWYIYRDMDSPVYTVEDGMYVFRITTDERMRY